MQDKRRKRGEGRGGGKEEKENKRERGPEGIQMEKRKLGKPRERKKREGNKARPVGGEEQFSGLLVALPPLLSIFCCFFFLRRMEGRKSRGVGAGAERGVENGRVKGWKGVEERKQKDKRRHFSITCPAHKNEIRKYQFW